MAILVNMHKAKSDLSRLVSQALGGEEIIITRAGKPVARLVPVQQDRSPGLATGRIRISADFDAPLPEQILRDFGAK